jgi:hypothetical protein
MYKPYMKTLKKRSIENTPLKCKPEPISNIVEIDNNHNDVLAQLVIRSNRYKL